jgi:mono/diheme cytochrome c family protein
MLRILLPAFLGICVAAEAASTQQEMTSAERASLRRIEAGIDRAGRLFKNRKYPEAAALIRDVAKDLERLLQQTPSAALRKAAASQHQRLLQARRLLVAQGQSIPAIAALPDEVRDPAAPVSFVQDVARILNNRCGTCHIQRQEGQLSMASYRTLAAGAGSAPVVIPGRPSESRLIEAIEDGTMPPNAEVPEDELNLLRRWIAEGARFDGPNADARLADMARPVERRMQVTRPAGNETVSFSSEIAPVLIARCGGCHYEAGNVRGGLRMDDFRQLLQGGDSGPPWRPGDSAGSLLVQRLTANDNSRMPLRRPPLEPEVINRIIRWVEEGAVFDGRTATMNLREVAAIAASEAATHEQLAENRRQAALRNWKKVMPDAEPVTMAGRELLVVGAGDGNMLESISRFGDTVSGQIKQRLDVNQKEPLVKGRISVFVFSHRYDYSEFGRMIENRELPREWRSHWRYDTVDAWTAMLPGSDDWQDLKPELTQRLAALAVAAGGRDVPVWFAEGLGYVVAESVVTDKAVIKAWQTRAAAAAASMSQPGDFLEGRMADDQSALVAWVFVKALKQADAKRFRNFLDGVRGGTPFPAAFTAAWSASPVQLIQQQSGGQSPPNNRPGRNSRRN